MTLAFAIVTGAIIALLVLSGFFSGSETALTATSRARMHELERKGNRRASTVKRLVQHPERLIGAILLGNNLVNILASALATTVFLKLFGDAGVVYATLVMTALVLILSEVMPKTYAITNPDRMALFVAPVLRWVVMVLAPVTAAVQFIVRATLKLLGVDVDDTENVLSAHDELRGVIDLHHLEGGVVKDDRDMLGGILDLRDLEVSDVMVHRTKMQTIETTLPNEEIVDAVLSSGYTRMPVWENEQDNIVGILHAKDVLKGLMDVGGDIRKLDIQALSAKPWFVPDTTSVPDQLDAFLKRKAHFAIVVDEYGEVMGLLTLEDILEEIVGDISDEHDIQTMGVRPQPDGSVTVEGAVAVRDLNRAMDWTLPDEEATTIAGLVIHEARTIPEIGQAFTFYGFTFEVLRKRRNQLTLLRVRPLRNPG